MSRSYLWPRLEVFDLVIPALSQSGRSLTQALVLDITKQLTRVQNTENNIRWVVVAKDFLKWNDSCIKLFWDMLHIATWSNTVEPWKRHAEAILIDHVVIFLVLHIQESTGKPSSPSAAYDAVWPTNDHEITSPVSPPSPVRSGSQRKQGNSSPMSPRNSLNSPSSQSSPKRSLLLNSRQCRSATHILSSIKQKIPLLLRCLSSDDFGLGVEGLRLEDHHLHLQNDLSITAPNMHEHDLMLSKRSLNSLGLILGGGWSREIEVTPLSLLYPALAPASTAQQQFPFSDAFSWIGLSICLNDIVYPSPSPFPAGSSFGSPPHYHYNPSEIDGPVPDVSSGSHSTAGSSGNLHIHNPIRNIFSLSLISSARPVTMSGFSSTMLLLATASPVSLYHQQQNNSRSSTNSGRHMDSTEGDAASESESMSEGIKMNTHSDENDVKGHQYEPLNDEDFSEFTDSLQRSVSVAASVSGPAATGQHGSGTSSPIGASLPHLHLQACNRASMYLLEPFSSACISNCMDSTFVVPAVSGAVLVTGCERVSMTIACSKLILRNCLDCDIKLATLSTTIVYGDSRGITLAPFNCTYRQHRVHMQLARLQPLYLPANNNWASVCDVGACLDAPPPSCSPSGYALDVGGEGEGLPLPSPQESTATNLPLDKFFFISVPIRGEHQVPELCAIPPPQEYAEAVTASRRSGLDLQSHVAATVNTLLERQPPASTSTGTNTPSPPLIATNELVNDASAALSKNFMDWLVASGKAQHVLDLIRLDSENASSRPITK